MPLLRAHWYGLHRQCAEALRPVKSGPLRIRAALAAWLNRARPNQLPPAGDWLVWLLLAGRGFGKTRTGAEQSALWMIDEPGVRIALIAATFDDGRDTMVEGESGLLSVLDRYGVAYTWNRSLGQLIMGNGSRADLYSGEKPRQLRGPQHHYAWADEMAWWMHPRTTWDNLLFGLRLGDRPRILVSTTPRPMTLLSELVAAPDTVLSTGSTMENAANLPRVILDKLIEQYDGTTLGQQELYGILAGELDGALWSRALLKVANEPYPLPEFDRIVVTIDPAVTSSEEADATGLCVAARGPAPVGWAPPADALDAAVALAAPHLYVLHSEQDKWTPTQACARAVELALLYGADELVVEANNGGDYLTAVLDAALTAAGVTIRVSKVTATRKKITRAEPTVALYSQSRAHHVGKHEALEDQLVSYTGDGTEASPDLMDALVWAQARLIPLDVKQRRKRRAPTTHAA